MLNGIPYCTAEFMKVYLKKISEYGIYTA